MKGRATIQLLVLVGLTLLLALSPASVAQDSQPPAVLPQEKANPPLVPIDPDEPRLPAGELAAMQRADLDSPAPPEPAVGATAAPHGSDDFGYTCDVVPQRWIETRVSGFDTGLLGDDAYRLLPIGFAFPFYDQSYRYLYASTNGLLTFGAGSKVSSNGEIPSSLSPNALIAAFWDDLAVGSPYNTGEVYWTQGDDTAGQYLVVEWYNVTRKDSTNTFTFEAILRPNGEVVLQYRSLLGKVNACTVGIEDQEGSTGLQYVHDGPGLYSGLALRFSRNDPQTRLKVSPPYQGALASPGKTADFPVIIRNRSNATLASDTYTVTATSDCGWDVDFYLPGGASPVTQVPNVAPGSRITITARVAVGGSVGDHGLFTVTVQSGQDVTLSRTAKLQVAVPAPFAQIYAATPGEATSLYLAHQAGQAVRKLTADAYDVGERAVAETNDGGFVGAWVRKYDADPQEIERVEYTLLDRVGRLVATSQRLDSARYVDTVDSSPSVAQAADGRIGVAYVREYRNSANMIQRNAYLAILNPDGSRLLDEPLALTGNTVFTSSISLLPNYFRPHIAATSDSAGRYFVVAFQEERKEAGGYKDNILVAVRKTNGSLVKAPFAVTSDTAGDDLTFGRPNLVAVAGGAQAFLTYDRYKKTTNQPAVYSILYNVLGARGTIASTGPGNGIVVADGTENRGSDAAEIADGKIGVAWSNGRIRYAVLNLIGGACYPAAGPTTLSNPAAPGSEDRVSVTPGGAGRAILTWTDGSGQRRNLYYALLDDSAQPVTPPQIFLSGGGAAPVVSTSSLGQGLASFRPFDGVDAWVQAPAQSVAWLSQPAAIAIRYGNDGQTAAASLTLTATLPSGLTYASDDAPVGHTLVDGGQKVVWDLSGQPAAELLGEGGFTLCVSAASAAPGTSYSPLTLTIGSAGPEAHGADNTASVAVQLPYLASCPLVRVR